MNHTYRISGIDKRGGHKRSEVISAWSVDNATTKANRMGLIFDDVEQLPTVRQGGYEIIFAVAKLLTLFAAVCVFVFGYNGAQTIFQQILAASTACFLGILGRVFQAEEHSRRTNGRSQ